MLEQFSERSRRVIFLARMAAGRRGASTLDPAHLLDAVVREDQGEMVTRLPGAVTRSGPLQPERSFLSAGLASHILSMLEHVLPPQGKPIADSADMECSAVLGKTFDRATALAKGLHHDKVEPLHLVAVLISPESGDVGEILKQAGISREAVIAAIQP